MAEVAKTVEVGTMREEKGSAVKICYWIHDP